MHVNFNSPLRELQAITRQFEKKNFSITPLVKLSTKYFQAAYNGDSEILQPVVLHNGEISDHLQEHYGDRLSFVQTPDGQINYDSILGCVQNVFQ